MRALWFGPVNGSNVRAAVSRGVEQFEFLNSPWPQNLEPMVMIGELKKAMEEEDWDRVEGWFASNSLDTAGNEFLILLAKKQAPVKMVEFLIRHGADVNEENQFGDSPLTIAIWYGAGLAFLECLLRAGAEVNHQNHNGNSPLTLAAETNNLEVVDLLLKFEANVHLENLGQDTALTLAIWKRAGLGLVEKLIQAGANVKHQSKNGNTPLVLASEQNGELALIQLLIRCGADANVGNKYGDTALMAGVRNNCRLDIVAALLDEGNADVNRANKDGNSALMLAAESNSRVEIVQALVNHRFINVNLRNKRGDTALTLAAWQNASVGVVKLLIRSGVSIKIRNENGNTALVLAEQAQASPLLIKLLQDLENNSMGKVDFDEYVDIESLLLEIVANLPTDVQRTVFDKLVDANITSWKALRAVTLDLCTQQLKIKLGDAAQLVRAIHQADGKHQSLFRPRNRCSPNATACSVGFGICSGDGGSVLPTAHCAVVVGSV
ncbi:hypothetical protein BASA81_007147 [Batrachochytrium salamandrivorans]|nr:hypothetical protein BASA81_007147 [Batrachochytrium salamandrivorans]